MVSLPKANKVCGIYMIFCWRSGKCYVGSSKGIGWRWRCHQFGLKRGDHYCSHLQRAWSKHGPNAFYLLILERCSEQERLQREQFYLNAAGPCDLYNSSKIASYPGATPEILRGRSERAKQQHREGRLGRASWTEVSERSFRENSHGNTGPRSAESIEKMRKTKREVEWANPERRQRQADIARELMERPTHKRFIRKCIAAYWTPEQRAAQSERARAQGFGKQIRGGAEL